MIRPSTGVSSREYWTNNPDWNVACAEDGAEALARFGPTSALVVTDMQMPRLSGLELVAAVRRSSHTFQSFLMTSQGSEEIALKALGSGAASYSPKSQLAQDLAETVRAVLSVTLPQPGDPRVSQRRRGDSLSFVLDNDSSLIPPLIGVIQEKVVEPCLHDDGDLIRVGVALEEALANALYHGNLEIRSALKDQDDRAFYALAKERRDLLPYRDRRIYVDARRGEEQITVVIRDERTRLRPFHATRSNRPGNLKRAHGRGLFAHSHVHGRRQPQRPGERDYAHKKAQRTAKRPPKNSVIRFPPRRLERVPGREASACDLILCTAATRAFTPATKSRGRSQGIRAAIGGG